MNSRFRLLLATAVTASFAGSVAAQVFDQTFNVGADVPDDSSTGLLDTQTVALANPLITGLTLNLKFSPSPGGTAFLGDLYAYVQHGDTIAVLLNRPGRRSGETAGYDDNQSIDVTFSDGAPDVHNYRISDAAPLAGPLTGTFGPDGRGTDPASVLATDSRTSMLSGFAGANANGDWQLFVADLSGGGAHRLESWNLTIQTLAVPEPHVWAAAGALVAFAGWRIAWRRRRRDSEGK